MSTNAVILLFTLLLLKHALADLNLQGRLKGNDMSKFPVFSDKNALHSLDHAALSLLVTVIFAPLWLAALLATAEFFVHYLIDFSKTRIKVALNIGVKDRAFWKLQGYDQMAHMLTYAAMVTIIAN